METGIAIGIALLAALSIALGMYFERRRQSNLEPQGTLNVDYSDPEDGPYLFLELKVPIADVVSRERVIFDVNVTQYVSQK